MITVEQWRCAIGKFIHPKLGRVRTAPYKVCDKFQDYSFAARWLVTGCTLWFMLTVHWSITCLQTNFHLVSTHNNIVIDCITSGSHGITNVCTHELTTSESLANFSFSSLLKDGDIESHPGPEDVTNSDLATLIQELKGQMKTVNERISAMTREIANLREMNEAIEENKHEISRLHDYIDELHTRQEDSFKNLHRRIDEQDRKQEKQEIYSRRENIILKGIPEEDDENVKNKIIEILNASDTGEKVNNEDFQRVHRVGKKEQGKNRPVIARFVHFVKKIDVMKSKEEIKQKKGVKVVNDLTFNQRKTLADHNKSHPQDSIYFKGDQLFINGVRRDPDTRSGHDAWRHGGRRDYERRDDGQRHGGRLHGYDDAESGDQSSRHFGRGGSGARGRGRGRGAQGAGGGAWRRQQSLSHDRSGSRSRQDNK